jgi:hypothetical protein
VKRVAGPGAIVLFEGKLARVVSVAEGRTVELELLDETPCSHCGSGSRRHLLEHSPLFQHHVRAVETVEESARLSEQG